MNQPRASTLQGQPEGPQQDLPLPLDNVHDDHEQPTVTQPAAPAAKPVPQQEPPPATARQTRSGRVIKNTARYEQSLSLRDQGLVAWELLIDQDEQESRPTAATQFALQRHWMTPLPSLLQLIQISYIGTRR